MDQTNCFHHFAQKVDKALSGSLDSLGVLKVLKLLSEGRDAEINDVKIKALLFGPEHTTIQAKPAIWDREVWVY